MTDAISHHRLHRPTGDAVIRWVDISVDGLYRHSLMRKWGGGSAVTWVMLNPSTADAEVDDPTIRRVIGFSKRENFDRLYVVNLFDYRATKPADLFAVEQPASIWNAPAIMNCLAHSRAVVCAWGAGASKIRSSLTVAIPAAARHEYRIPTWCLGKTQAGWPRHPLYVAGNQPFEVFP